MASGTETCLSLRSLMSRGLQPRGLTRDKVAEVVEVGQAIWGAAQAAKVCGQALRRAHGVRRIAAGGAAFPKVEGLLAQPCAHCVLKQELHNRTSGLCCMRFWAVPPKSSFGTLLRCSRAEAVILTSQGTVP